MLQILTAFKTDVKDAIFVPLRNYTQHFHKYCVCFFAECYTQSTGDSLALCVSEGTVDVSFFKSIQ